MWRLFEPVHGVPYLSPASSATWEDAGLKGYWRSYFAGRAAPLGPVEAAPVIGAFFSFSPAMVSTVVPAIWTHLSTEKALAVRLDAARAALEPHLGALSADELAELAGLLRSVVERLPVAGRVLGAANAALPGRTTRSAPCGRPPPRCGSTAATAISPRWSQLVSTARRALSGASAGAAPTGRSTSGSGAGRTMSGTRRPSACARAAGSTPPARRPRRPAAPPTTSRRSRTGRPARPGTNSARRARNASPRCSPRSPAPPPKH